MGELLLKDEVYAVVGAAMEVWKVLGAGFLEPVYHEAMLRELGLRSVPFESKKPVGVTYKGQLLEKAYVPDLLCYGQVIVELKAIDRLSGREEAQILNYLKATGLRVGVLINFGGAGALDWKRFVR